MLVALGWDEQLSALYQALAEPGHVPGRVSRVDRDRCSVHTVSGKSRASASVLPATGDWVVLRTEPRPTIEHILPRRSTLERAGQVLAANVDIVLVVASLDRPLNLNRVERELVLAWDSGARPVVVLTKADSTAEAPALAEVVSARAVGVEVLLTSATTGQGVDAVLAQLRPNRSAVFLGPSGSGKSTLVNRMLKEDRQAIGEVRAGDHKGRHTTSSRHLLVVPGGGVLIDTPGLRSVGLEGAEAGVAMTFPDVEEMARGCRFRDCVHTGEPGCAVVAAVAGGRLDRDRVASYRKLQAELEEGGREPWAKSAETQQSRTVQKGTRKSPKKR